MGDWFFLLSLIFLEVELVRYHLGKKLDKCLMGDTLSNFLTQPMFYAFTIVLFYGLYVSSLSFAHQFSIFEINVSWATVALCIVIVDFAYYWEHRFSHRVSIAWATHTVHHSSPNFNISVAYRFGPMDALWPIVFHIPIVVIGFDPFVVVFSEFVVLLYQTPLHTELVGKLPRPIEAVFNTPSHHRVHHGSNKKYMDKNYGGIFIIWDRLFGIFETEKEPVAYGISEPLESVNPLKIFFHGLVRLWLRVMRAPDCYAKLLCLLKAPDWKPASAMARSTEPVATDPAP